MSKAIREKNVEFFKKFQQLLEDYNAEIVVNDESGNIDVMVDNNLVSVNNKTLKHDTIKFFADALVNRFGPSKRTALDGKVWWVVFDYAKCNYSKFIMHGKYKTKSDCQWAIDRSLEQLKDYDY